MNSDPPTQNSDADEPSDSLWQAATISSVPDGDGTTPAIVGEHRVLGRLGKGGMGEVFRVRDDVIGRDVALKVLRHGADPLAVQRFVQEARLTGQLEHPNIVPVHTLAPDAETPFFTMKHVVGEDLGSLLLRLAMEEPDETTARVPRHLPDLLRVFDRVCDALRYAHSHGVIHRDLKPANIMIGEFGEVQLMDWGLAKVQGTPEAPPSTTPIDATRRTIGESSAQLTVEGGVLGTPAYMPPEQARGELDRVGVRSDIYALGALLYQMLTLHPPYTGESVEQILDQVRRGDLVRPSRTGRSVPWELEAATLRAMATRPEDRYASVAELQADVASFLTGDLLAAADYTTLQRVTKWIARNKVVTLFILFSTATAVVIGHQLRRAQHAEQVALASEKTSRMALGVARQSAEASQERLRRFEQLADLSRARTLREQAETTLWPIGPEMIEPAQRWLAELDRLAARLPQHRTLITELGKQPRASRSHVDNVLLGALSEFVDVLNSLQSNRGLAHPYRPNAAGVRRRIEIAGRLGEWRRQDAGRWSAAAERGWPHGPLPGLRPLGPDPRSKREEFAFLPSGDAPTRGPDGRLALTDRTAIVFVALPAGRFRMGADRTSDPGARDDERPIDRRVGAMLVSKYELTRHQWQQLAGTRPGLYVWSERDAVTPRHPIEGVSWREATRMCDRWRMALPTEAEWEYLARAGARTPWWTGAASAALEGAANLADAAFLEAHRRTAHQQAETWNDRWPGPMPVGALRANRFGLHDVLGNVGEWTASPYRPRHGDDASAAAEGEVVYRGGAWNDRAADARLARRHRAPRTFRSASVGLRPVIRLGRRTD